ncbi:MAG: TetR family transcriptional regulator [Pseudonocardiales bacterium]|nr:TetR family transcriptional regulator [Pseudonocardiales bacterium]
MVEPDVSDKDVAAAAGEADLSLSELAARRPLRRIQAGAEQDVRKLIDTARELMTSGSMPRVADIVRAAGLSNDAFYRYFKTKDDLVAAIVDDGSRRLLDAVGQRMKSAKTPREQVRIAVQTVLKQATDPKVALATRNVFGNSSRVENDERGGRVRMEQGLAGLLLDPLAALGAADPKRDSMTAGVLIMGMLNHFLWQNGSLTGRDVDHLIGFVVSGAGVTTVEP